MKQSLQCVKCEGRVIVHIARMELPTVEPGFRRNHQPLALTMRKRLLNPSLPVGGFETFICKSCGYTEWYAIDLDDLDPAKDPNVRILDNEPKATLR